MAERKVRVRFAPSPTGPLHMGGVRTALYNYLFAKKNNGDFILRIEDTDQNRFVPGAEDYIIESLKWCGIQPNEGVGFGDGPCKPYRQSERKAMYSQYADQLVKAGHAYHAFDTSEELEEARLRMEKAGGSFSYNAITRQNMKNSLSLSDDEVQKRISAGEHYVVRIKIPRNEEIRLHDIIRGWVVVHSSQMDDKVLFKSDGMPTYHLANVVDDYMMKITHVIRGEEWLPSAPLHVLLYEYLGWKDVMPEFAHLPLLLRPDGNGKLSKRDGDRLGFPVFPLNWVDPVSKEQSSGYREKGYFPDAFINMLVLLGWHPSGNKELFSLEELVNEFTLDRVSKHGAKFDPEKTKWFNQQYLRIKTDEELAKIIWEKEEKTNFYHNNVLGKISFIHTITPIASNDQEAYSAFKNSRQHEMSYLICVCSLMKEKCSFIDEIISMGYYFFRDLNDEDYDKTVIAKRWNDKAKNFIVELSKAYRSFEDNDNLKKMAMSPDKENLTVASAIIEGIFKVTCEKFGIKTGEVMQLFRVCISGVGGGPALFEVAALLGKEEVVKRLETAVKRF